MKKNVIATVLSGKLEGKIGTDLNGKAFYMFLGIPYAKPPLGQLRFKSPQPAESWVGVRDATVEGQACFSKPLRSGKKIVGGEDCLFLNVFTPDLSKDNVPLKPVMVWIHGGAFVSGSASPDTFGPEFLMIEDIVLVTINYRTSILGFLSLEDPDLKVPGNAGLKDMIMALQWVQANIISFAGNPSNVTIFGESAGGAAVHYLILSSRAKGLFHKAILQSGCALNSWTSSRRYSYELAKVLALNTTDERKLLKVIQYMPLDKLYEAVAKIPNVLVAGEQPYHGPVIERYSNEAFLSDYPADIIKSGRYNKVPMMITYTTGEGMFSEILQKGKSFTPVPDFELAVPFTLNLERGSDKSKLVAKKIKEFYYKNEEPSNANKDTFYLLEGDNFFVRGLIQTAKLHREASPHTPIYLARISVETELNLTKKKLKICHSGVAHSDDLSYIFRSSATPQFQPGSEEDIAVRRFVRLWTNFAKSGHPTSKWADPLIKIKWKPVDGRDLHFVDIGKELVPGINPDAERMAFWDDILKINPACKL